MLEIFIIIKFVLFSQKSCLKHVSLETEFNLMLTIMHTHLRARQPLFLSDYNETWIF